MSEQKHTPGPWRVKGRHIVGADHGLIADTLESTTRPRADARRIVACVNTCEGLSTEQLERFPLDSLKECAQSGIASTLHELELEKQRDELLAACMALVEARDGLVSGMVERTERAMNLVRDAITKCKEG